MAFTTIQRDILAHTDEDTGATIHAKVLGADEWLRYQQTLYSIDQQSVSAYVKLRMDFGKEWITRLKGYQFDDGALLTLDDVGLLPPALILAVHDAVLEHISVKKSNEE